MADSHELSVPSAPRMPPPRMQPRFRRQHPPADVVPPAHASLGAVAATGSNNAAPYSEATGSGTAAHSEEWTATLGLAPGRSSENAPTVHSGACQANQSIRSEETFFPTMADLPCAAESPQLRPTPEPDQPALQSLLTDRLAGLAPEDFCADGAAIFLTMPLTVPLPLRSRTRIIQGSQIARGLTDDDLELIHASLVVLLFCDVTNDDSIDTALCFNYLVGNRCSNDAPPCIFLSHSGTGEEAAEAEDFEYEYMLLAEAMESGMDCCICGQPAGIELACAVQSQLLSRDKLVRLYDRRLSERYREVQHVRRLQFHISDSIWGHVAARLYVGMPPLSHDLLDCSPGRQLDNNFKIGKRFAAGASGTLYRLLDLDGKQVNQVAKVIEKLPRTSMDGVKNIRNEIYMLKRLSDPEFRHKHIIKFFEVYHSESHILFRMEDGGLVNLQKYILWRDTARAPLSTAKAELILSQCCDGLAHMHLGAQVVHRDIKSENIVISESSAGFCIKIIDFDLSRLMDTPGLSSFYGGTFPFMAPELLLGHAYNPFPTDIWSMGVVFLEVLCGMDILVKKLNLPRLANSDANKERKERAMLRQIFDYIQKPSTINELVATTKVVQSPGDVAPELIDCMLKVDALERITAEELREFVNRNIDKDMEE